MADEYHVDVQQIVLPGALGPIAVAENDAYLEVGLTSSEIVAVVNLRWREATADRLEPYAGWGCRTESVA